MRKQVRDDAGVVKKRPMPRRKRQGVLGEAKVWAELLGHLKGAVLIMDELDLVTHPMKSELSE